MVVQPLIRIYDIEDKELHAYRMKPTLFADLATELVVDLVTLRRDNPTAIRTQVDFAIPNEIHKAAG